MLGLAISSLIMIVSLTIKASIIAVRIAVQVMVWMVCFGVFLLSLSIAVATKQRRPRLRVPRLVHL